MSTPVIPIMHRPQPDDEIQMMVYLANINAHVPLRGDMIHDGLYHISGGAFAVMATSTAQMLSQGHNHRP